MRLLPDDAPAREPAERAGAAGAHGDEPAGPALRPARLGSWPLAAGVAAVLVAGVLGVVVGPVPIDPVAALRSLVGLGGGLDDTSRAIVAELRLPRVVLGLLVGATLATCGAGYQAVFRNPLADPYLLGAAAGAGAGVTLVLTGTVDPGSIPLTAPAAAFIGALVAVAATWLLGAASGGRGSTVSMILAGVAVTSFLTAIQTFVQQRNADTVRTVYSWILGRLSTSGWHDVVVMLPYALVAGVVLLASRRVLDVLAVGDEEATTLGIDAARVRALVVVAASLGTAAAVSVSGLIGFVGIIVPHTIRLLFGTSNRVVLPLSVLFGGAFLCLADLLARTASAPAEIPIGVVTAFFGAPFFFVVLRTSRRRLGP